MKKSLLLLATVIISFNGSFGQNISDIKIDPTGENIAYIKDSDSLFVKNLHPDSPDIFVAAGLKMNGIQRILTWSRSGENLVYLNNNKIHTFNLTAKKSKLISHKYDDSLGFFRFYLINQVDLSDDDILYFSAWLKTSENQEFQLFRLDLLDGNIEKLTNDTLGIANVSVSADNKYIVYTSYTTAAGWRAKINIIRSNDGKLIAESDFYEGTFFYGLAWSPDDTKILARNARGGERIFKFDDKKMSLEEDKLPDHPDLRLLRFFSNDVMYGLEYKENKKAYILYNLLNGNKQTIDSDINLTLASTIVKKSDGGQRIYFTRESRVQPIELLKTDVAEDHISEREMVHSFNKNNLLEAYKYVSHNYKNGNGTSSSSYIYFPAEYDRDSSKKYPLLIVTYGTFSDIYPNFNYFLYSKLFTYLDKNYAIAFVNTRGIGWERQMEKYGELQLEDMELFIEDASPKYNFNTDKVVVLGHSHGATMVYYYLTHSNIFAGGIAANGAADWIEQAKLKSMDGLPDAMGGSPEDLGELYSKFSPIENINNLETPLLIVSGALDTQIPADINAENFYNKAKSQNKEVKHLHFPDDGHVIKKEQNRKLFWEAVDWFLKNI